MSYCNDSGFIWVTGQLICAAGNDTLISRSVMIWQNHYSVNATYSIQQLSLKELLEKLKIVTA